MLEVTAINCAGDQTLSMEVASIVQQGRACDLLRQRGPLLEVHLRITPPRSLEGAGLDLIQQVIEAPLAVASAALALMSHHQANQPLDQRSPRLIITLDQGCPDSVSESTSAPPTAADGDGEATDEYGPLQHPLMSASSAFWRQWAVAQQRVLDARGLGPGAGGSDIHVEVITRSEDAA